jgi:hypothetical protein
MEVVAFMVAVGSTAAVADFMGAVADSTAAVADSMGAADTANPSFLS